MKTIRIIVISGALLASSVAHATFIQLGEIDLTGTFTLNHLYDFNNPASQPFGNFSTLTVSSVSGLFIPHVQVGDTLGMNTQFMFGPISPINSDVSSPMIWSIGGFTIDTQQVSITGADFVGRNCLAITTLSGHGFDPNMITRLLAQVQIGALRHRRMTSPISRKTLPDRSHYELGSVLMMGKCQIQERHSYCSGLL